MPKPNPALLPELVSEETEATLLELTRALGDEDGYPLNAGGESAIAALAAGDEFARAWLLRTEVGGPIVGFLLLTLGFSIEYGGRDGIIDALYVVPDARGQGVGSAALAFAAEEARKLGIKALHLGVMRGNERARALYRKHGYTEVGFDLMNKWL